MGFQHIFSCVRERESYAHTVTHILIDTAGRFCALGEVGNAE